MNSDFSCYALSMFTDRPAFEEYHNEIGENCDYDTMRSEVGAAHFGGDSAFTTSDILKVFPDETHFSVAGDSHSAAGGHSHGAGDSGMGH